MPPRTVSCFPTSFDPILWWIIGTVLPNSDDIPGVLQPHAAAYADDSAVAAPSFRLLMPATSDVFFNIALLAGLRIHFGSSHSGHHVSTVA